MERTFPAWEKLYQSQDVKTMPWYQEGLDKDVEKAFLELGIDRGDVLDLGSGPGTQAIAMAKIGFNVTATDIAASAVKQARRLAGLSGLTVDFIQDDILDSKLKKRFDFILDRGLFHVLSPDQRPEYVNTVAGLLKSGGMLFLKCFSHLQKGEGGPYRFTPEQIRDYFSPRFEIVSISDTVFHGTLQEFPRALFCVLKLKNR